MRRGPIPPSSAGTSRVAKTLLKDFDATDGPGQENIAPYSGSVGSCAPSFCKDNLCKDLPKPAIVERFLLDCNAHTAEQGTPPLSPAEMHEKAIKLQRKSSPHAVRMNSLSPQGKPAVQEQGLLGEDPSSRSRAERLMHDLKYVGDWQLVSLLGMGGMSNVYLAQHKQRSSAFSAIKMTKDYIVDPWDKENDPCYSSTMLEWRTYQRFRQPSAIGVRARRSKSAAAQPAPPKRKLPTSSASETRPVKLQKVVLPPAEAGARLTNPPEAGRGALPVAYSYGFIDVQQNRREHGWIAMQLLGLNLHAVGTDNSNPLSWKSFYKLATGMLAAVRELHNCSLVHRDIKPGNFCLGGSGDKDTIYLVDFGFALHLPQKGEGPSTEKFCGTPDFASSNALRGGRCGPKDDCESLCYSYMQLWNYGVIPWDITRNTPRVQGQGGALGLESSTEDLGWTPTRLQRMADDRACIWADMEKEGEIPPFLLSWQLYLSSLNVWELPNYSLLQRLLHNSCMSWDEHHPSCAKSITASPGSSVEDFKAAKNDNFLAAEE